MARGRMINVTVASDLRLNDLSLEAHCAYLMAIPHLDRDGLMLGHPRIVAGRICPLRPELGAKMAEIIQEWADAQLVIAYDTGNGTALYFAGFQKNQSFGASYSKEGKSAIPPPPGYIRTDTGIVVNEFPTNSRVTPDLLPTNSRVTPLARAEVEIEDKDKEEVAAVRARTHTRVTEEPAAATTAFDYDNAKVEPDVARVWEAWNANMPGTKSQVVTDNVNDLLTQYSATEIIEAIAIACKRNKRTLGYVQGVLSKGVYSQAPPANGYMSEEQKGAIRTRARLAQSSIQTAEKFGGTIDPQWQKDIEAAKGLI